MPAPVARKRAEPGTLRSYRQKPGNRQTGGMEHPSPTIATRALVAGSCASVLSAVVLALAGRREAGSAAVPINAVSHWYWGDRAFRYQDPDMLHTVVGYATHHSASVFWAALLAWYLQRHPERSSPAQLALASAATSAIACLVDFQFTPDRLTPGYEHRLSRKSLAITYAVFAVGLALGALLTTRPRPTRHR